MRFLVIFCHPCADSFNAAIYQTAVTALSETGHELRCHDLYREGFQPVMSDEERRNYLTTIEPLMTRNAQHVADLRWAEGLVVIYPSWFYGAPAMLKGWLECVWLPGVSFQVAGGQGTAGAAPCWTTCKIMIGITTSGSPWWWLKLIGDPGRNLWRKGLFPRFITRTRVIWHQLYNMNHATEADRKAFLAKVDRSLRHI